MRLTDKLSKTTEYLNTQGITQIDIGMILGSGLGNFAEELENPIFVNYSTIPFFKESTVAGHKGRIVFGTLHGKTILAMQGRYHYYEGHAMDDVTYPIRVMKELGAHSLIVTNAAGGVNPSFSNGVLMLINDHINLTGTNPLIGPNEETIGPRFPDMSQTYTAKLQAIAKKAAAENNLSLQEGVYAGFSGPSYETPAEIRFAQIIGADAVGMSTVPEAIVAAHCGLNVLGISCITNMAAGLQASLNHAEVVEVTQKINHSFKQLLASIVEKIGKES
ncbi:purine-nucleoside phosphorylase [Enterococcus sp. JM4C]|uniref:purine-nucleoside phosphorylase n=1 Tax=Candidatus Enterococcus huntleyi TaxID=1857217 RepID=UPI00137AB943|nr:purine-nucleoside phosphorylase [Enterococcus sp. JM4C]KAF1299413.1 purine-nucleoside phosphorylase [Enterococcus sp. JM4C]